MQTHDSHSSSFQPQSRSPKSRHQTTPSFAVSHPGQDHAASPSNPFAPRPHETWSMESVVAPPMVMKAPAESQGQAKAPESQGQAKVEQPREGQSQDIKEIQLDWSQGRFSSGGQSPPDPPTWGKVQAKLNGGRSQDGEGQESDQVAESVVTSPELDSQVQRQTTLNPSPAKAAPSGWLPLNWDPPQRASSPSSPWQGVQTKLTIGQPNDAYEQEADAVAAQVMAMPDSQVQRQLEETGTEESAEAPTLQAKPLADTITPLVQRRELPGNEDPVQLKCETCEQEEQVQRSSDSSPPVQTQGDQPPVAIQLDGNGMPPKTGKTTITKKNASLTASGKTITEAITNLTSQGKGEAGSVTCTPSRSFKTYQADDNADPVVYEADVQVTETKAMPTWTELNQQCEPIKKEWARFYSALDTHENGHISIDEKAFTNLHTKLLGKTETAADKIFDDTTTKADTDNATYDTTTQHGLTQGTGITVTQCGGLEKVSQSPDEVPAEPTVQTKSHPPTLQRAAASVPQVQPDLENRLSASRSGGTPLPDEVRSFMEPRFGADFSQVRVHTGGDAVQMSQELGAQAFTHGSHIYYGSGKAPAKDELTGHELTHVVQQTGNGVVSAKPIQGNRNRASISDLQRRPMIGNTVADPRIMRAPATQSGVGGKITVAKVPLGEKTFGPLMGEASVSLDISFEAIQGAAPDDGKSQTKVSSPIINVANGTAPAPVGPGGGPTKILVGPVGDATTGGIGIGAEAKYEIEQGVRSKILGWQPSIKGGGELTTKGAKFGVGVSIDTNIGPVPVTMTPLEFNIIKWEPGGKPKFAVCATSAEFQLAAFEHTTSDGKTYKVEAKPKLEFEFQPNPVHIGKWVAENLGKVVATEVGIAGSLIAGGLMTIGVALYQIANSGEITERTEFAVKKCKNYCRSAQNVLRGEAPIAEVGGPEGAAAASAILSDLNQKFPPELVTAEAKKCPLYANAWGQAWPKIRQQAIDDYWADHKFEHFIYGDGGTGGGFKAFKRVLDVVG